MGNGYFSKAEYLYSYIEAGDTARAADLVKVFVRKECRTTANYLTMY